MASRTPLSNRFNFDCDPERLTQVRRDTAAANRMFDCIYAVLPGELDEQLD